MKKIIYILVILGIGLVSCERSLDDTFDELELDRTVSGDIQITLTEEDYTGKIEDGGLDLRFPNFNSVDQAKQLIAGLLADRYPVLKDESTALVTYALFAPERREKSLIVYEVTNDDYDALELRFPNFSRDSHIEDFLELKYPSPSDRTLLSLTYDYFASGSVNELNNGFLFLDGAWKNVIGFTDEEYATMGERFPNFSSEEAATEKIAIILKDKLKFGGYKAGDIEATMYKLFVTDEEDVDGDGRTDDKTTYSYVKYFIFDGTNWSEYNNVISQQLQFGHDGEKWVPDNTIKYTLTAADYDLVDNGFFDNFDIRKGKSEEEIEARIAKINTILLNNFPDDEEGQKYIVTYNVFSGSNGILSIKLIKKNGVYIIPPIDE